MRFPKTISTQLRGCHEGVGFMYYNAGNEEVRGLEFCIGRGNQMAYVKSGTPVIIELRDENQNVRQFKVQLEPINGNPSA